MTGIGDLLGELLKQEDVEAVGWDQQARVAKALNEAASRPGEVRHYRRELDEYLTRCDHQCGDGIESALMNSYCTLVRGTMMRETSPMGEADALTPGYTSSGTYFKGAIESKLDMCRIGLGESDQLLIAAVATSRHERVVGLCVWPAAVRVLEWVEQNRGSRAGLLLEGGKHILELGAGTGVLGLGLARLLAGTGSVVTLTDHSPASLVNMRRNVALNGMRAGEVHRDYAEFHLAELDWLELVHKDDVVARYDDVDVLIASDCVYEYGASQAFAAALVRLIHRKARPALVGIGVHRRPVYEDWTRRLLDAGLQVERIALLPSHHFLPDLELEFVLVHSLL